MSNIKILEGTYKIRGVDTSIAGEQFELIKPYTVGASGGYVTVNGASVLGFPERNIKIKCEGSTSYTVVGEVVRKEESDTEIVERLRERFDILRDMTIAVKKGDVRAMIVSGPPGVGKSHGIEDVMARYETFNQLGAVPKYEFIKGTVSPLGLYCKLYEFAAKDNVVIFDDCDSVFDEPAALNILKAALDSKKSRTINWNTDSNKLKLEDIPNSFSFLGSAIFITNLKFENVRSKKLRSHLEALESRCHYIDLTIDTDREKMLRIKQIVQDGMLNEYCLDDNTVNDIVDFIETNKDRLRELSLRTVLKIADLAKTFPLKWEKMSENTVMHRA